MDVNLEWNGRLVECNGQWSDAAGAAQGGARRETQWEAGNTSVLRVRVGRCTIGIGDASVLQDASSGAVPLGLATSVSLEEGGARSGEEWRRGEKRRDEKRERGGERRGERKGDRRKESSEEERGRERREETDLRR